VREHAGVVGLRALAQGLDADGLAGLDMAPGIEAGGLRPIGVDGFEGFALGPAVVRLASGNRDVALLDEGEAGGHGRTGLNLGIWKGRPLASVAAFQ
jgi:hypothetical protein